MACLPGEVEPVPRERGGEEGVAPRVGRALPFRSASPACRQAGRPGPLPGRGACQTLVPDRALLQTGTASKQQQESERSLLAPFRCRHLCIPGRKETAKPRPGLCQLSQLGHPRGPTR